MGIERVKGNLLGFIMIKFTRILSVILFFSLLICCGDDPLPGGLILEMKAVTSESSINARKSASGMEFSKIMIGLMKLELETEDENEKERERGEEDLNEKIEFEGPFKVNLITGESAPGFGQILTDPGVYSEIEFKLGPVLDEGKTIEIVFTLDGKQYEITSEIDRLEIELEQVDGFKVDENLLNTVLVQIDLDTLFANVDLSSATADQDGVIRINEESNSSILEALLGAFDDSCDGGKDDDGDDKIDVKDDDDDSGDDD